MKPRLLVLTLFIQGCVGSHSKDQNLDASQIHFDSVDINVLKYDTSYSFFFAEKVEAADISKDEIVECELLLRDFISKYNEDAQVKYSDTKIDLKNYGRQYISVVNNKEEKIILGIFFCDPKSFEYRHKELVSVYDGGNCFFQCKFNLKNKSVFDFAENGTAYFGSPTPGNLHFVRQLAKK